MPIRSVSVVSSGAAPLAGSMSTRSIRIENPTPKDMERFTCVQASARSNLEQLRTGCSAKLYDSEVGEGCLPSGNSGTVQNMSDMGARNTYVVKLEII